jgi:hypothetical protein
MRILIPLLTFLTFTTVASQQTATPANVLCYQEIIGSNSNYATLDASISAWASKLETALGLSGDVHQYVDWAQVTDRTGFENGCDGPYTTVADVYVHVQTTSDAYDDLSSKLEAFVAANGWTSQPNVACGARSVVTYLPGCGKVAPTTLPTRAGSPTQAPTQAPTPSNVVCYQTIVGSSGTQAQVEASVSSWASDLETALALSGDVHQFVDWAVVPDRTSFENGCNGPYATVEDVFVHISTSAADYDLMSAALETFISNHPITGKANIACAARSVTTFLPTCGKAGGASPTQAATVAPTRASSPTEAATSAPTEAATSAPTEKATSAPTEAATMAPTEAATSAPTEKATSAPTEAATVAPTRASSPTEAATSAPTEAATSAPTEAATSAPTTAATSAPTTAATSAPTEAATSAPTTAATSAPTEAATAAPTRVNSPTENSGPTATPNNILCYQEIIGSNSNYAAVDASISAWASKLETALGFTGDVHQYVDWAQVKDRTGFENGCNGPYTAVADVFVHIETTADEYDGLSSKMEAFIAANAWTSQPNIACGARSVVTFIPGCGKLSQTGPNLLTTAPPTTGATSGPTTTPTTAGTSAPTTAGTSAPTTAGTSAPTTAGTSAPTTAGTSAPTTAGTSAPTTAATSAPTSGPTEIPTPANVVCYQSIFGTNTNYGNASATIEAWAMKLQAALNLTGDVHTIVDWSQVPDRTSFENCNGPYQTVADVFVHIPSDAAGYDALSLKLEAFVLANPLTAQTGIVCAARSVTTFLPTCGKVPTAPNSPGGGSGTVCYQSIVGSSNGTYAQVSVELQAWANKLASTLSLSGDIHQYVDWAQVPDRTSFENGCDGPYATVADIFVHIPTTGANYDTMVANVNSFQSTNSLVSASTGGVINCAARSVTDQIPICGMAPVAAAAADGTNSNTQTSTTSGAGSITITGSILITLVATLFRGL